jgi:alginate O-acetyltransferase complex protein AlgI
MGDIIFKKTKKIYLSFGLTINIFLLIFFKYTNFIFQVVNEIFGGKISLLNLILPVGISFYTLRVISYLIDVYTKKTKPASSLLDFTLYISFFPYILAGPIVRTATFIPHLKNKINILEENFKVGITSISIGLVKKLVFADNIAFFLNDFLMNPNAFEGAIFLGIFTFGIHLYCDFSGYSDIAIGIARLFGYKLGINFDYPYFAKDISEFWRKWHISLSSWLRDYIYIPLGGNRIDKLRTYFNLIITMVIAGIWHGASWTFIIWGLYLGSTLAIHKLFKDTGISNLLNVLGMAKNLISMVVTQFIVFFGWIFFSARNITDMIYMTKNIYYVSFSSLVFIMSKYYLSLFYLFLFVILLIITYLNKELIKNIEKTKLFYWTIYLLFIFIILLFLSPVKSSEFIYTKF